MTDTKVNPAFSHLLAFHMKKNGISSNAFAEKIGINETLLCRILKGHRYPPEDLQPWSKALGLRNDEREQFLTTGGLTRCPDYICDLVERLKRENEALQRNPKQRKKS